MALIQETLIHRYLQSLFQQMILGALAAGAQPYFVQSQQSGVAGCLQPFTDFTQHDPDDTMPATVLTSVRIVYDDEAIYWSGETHLTPRGQALLAEMITEHLLSHP